MRRALRTAALRVPPIGRLVGERDRLREEVRAAHAETRRLRRRRSGSQAEADPALGFVFIVAYGRSGSTLLQGVLNSIPGYLIRGENRDALHHLFRFHQTCTGERDRLGPTRGPLDSRHPFFGIDGFPEATSLQDLRRLALDTVLRPEPGTRVSGFKEIRWYHPDLIEYVSFLREVFPGARFVINTRDHADVVRSKWWADHDDPERELDRIEHGFDRLAAQLGEAAHRVHYDDYAADPGALTGLLDWLDEPFEPDRIAAVYRVRHST
jgi:hypothetical protein